MNPVDAHVGEKQEEDHTEEEAGPTQRMVTDVVVQFAVSSDLGKKQGHSGDADPRQRGHGILDLPPNLVQRRISGIPGLVFLR